MRLVVLTVAVIIGLSGLSGTALAIEQVQGILNTGGFEAFIDSTRVIGDTWTIMAIMPDWGGTPGVTDTADYPLFASWPMTFKLYTRVGGNPVVIPVPEPRSDTWYLFPDLPPQDAPKVMFKRLSGVAEPGIRTAARMRFSASPSVANGAVLVRCEGVKPGHSLLEVYDAAGNCVRSLAVSSAGTTASLFWFGDDESGRRLADGIYYLRFESAGNSAVGKVTLAR